MREKTKERRIRGEEEETLVKERKKNEREKRRKAERGKEGRKGERKKGRRKIGERRKISSEGRKKEVEEKR